MKENKIHTVFVIDSSGSMYSSREDVIGGWKTTLEQQRGEQKGECIVSLFTFNDDVKEVYLGKDINEVGDIDYQTMGMTSLYDGIGVAVDRVGQWLSEMDESERPSKNLVVIMTDGCENNSSEYTLDRVKDMIKHQEDVYDWTFVYLGTDVTTLKDVDNLGIKTRGFSSREDMGNTYTLLNDTMSAYRMSSTVAEAAATMDCLHASCLNMTKDYEIKNNITLS